MSECGVIFGGNELLQLLTDELCPLDPQQLCKGEIGFNDVVIRIKGEQTKRGCVIECLEAMAKAAGQTQGLP